MIRLTSALPLDWATAAEEVELGLVKVTLKLAIAVLPGALAVVAAAAVLELARDRAEFEADQRADDRAVAGAFAASLGKLWEAFGEGSARAAMNHLRTFDARYRMSWVDLGGAGPDLPAAERSALLRGEEAIWRAGQSDPAGWLHAMAPIRAGGVVVGAVDVSEPPPDLRAHVGRTVRATILTTLALATIMVLMTLLVGVWVVGRPISALIAQARRVGAGDLRARSLPRQRDELGELARELNRMLDLLEVAAGEVRESTRARLAALEQLRHADRLTTIGRLASSVAHELGTPLNVVAGRARLVIEDEPAARVHAAIIIDQAERMTTIIRQLLDYGRRRPPRKEPQDLVRIASGALTLLATLAHKRGVQLRFRAEVSAALVTADPTQLQQALTNLVVNAIQASANGGIVDLTLKPVRAHPPARASHVHDEALDGRADGEARAPENRERMMAFELEVKDHGAGMPPEVLARVFEPFFTTKPTGESTGLGLSVSHDIVDEHDGWIEAESEPGRGSRFRIVLPRRAA